MPTDRSSSSPPAAGRPAAPGQSAAIPVRSGRYAFLVATGILASRIAGLARDRVFAHYFGNSAAADAFKAAFRIPNFLQNLFGEGVLSASFIPVYAGLLARGDRERADRVAGAVVSLLALIVSVLVVAGVLATPLLIDLVAPGFSGEKRLLTIRLVRILFPGAGILVLSAWCLGVLNSHRRFLLSYTAPVVWNVALIAVLIGLGGRLGQFPLAVALAWGSVAGSALQLAVQLPTVRCLARGLRPALGMDLAEVRTVAANFLPVFIARGVVQISAYIDALLASLLPTGAVAALAYAQTLYLLPVSLFGMSVSAAELPLMASAVEAAGEASAELRRRLAGGLRRISFFVVPSAVALAALGDVIAAAVYQTGEFDRSDSIYVWGIMAGASVGLPAGTLGRLYSSTFYALKDTRTPLAFAVLRVALTIGLGIAAALHLPGWLGIEPRWGAAGLALASGLAGWIEFALLRRALARRIGHAPRAPGFQARLWGAAGIAALAGWGIRLALAGVGPVPLAAAVLGSYGMVYLALTGLLRVPESAAVIQRLRAAARRFRG